MDLVCSDSHSRVVGRPGEVGDSVAAGQTVRLQHLQLSRRCKAVEGTALQRGKYRVRKMMVYVTIE